MMCQGFSKPPSVLFSHVKGSYQLKPQKTKPKKQAAKPPTPRSLEAWLAHNSRWIVLAILAVSLALRAATFLELNRGPCVWQHRWPETDMYFFDAWARDIAAGDWLTDKALHPYLGWHRALAEAYLRERPDEAARLAGATGPDGQPTDAGKALWAQWYGGKQFHQEPLYAYLVALTYKSLGEDARWVFAWQLLLGALGNVLIYLIARRHFGHGAGALAGLLAVLCGPLLFYEMVLLRTAVITFLGLLLVVITGPALEKPRASRWFMVGLVLGLGLLLNSTFAPFGIFAAALLAHTLRKTPAKIPALLISMILGITLCLAPAVARNIAVGAPPLTTSSVGTMAFICNNTADYDPSEPFFISYALAPRILAESGNRPLAAVLETLRTHDSPGSYLRLLWSKLSWAWFWYEKPNNKNFYYYRLHSAVLRFLPVTFLVLAPLGIVGLFLAARKHGGCGILYALVLTSLLPLILFNVLSRFRAPLVAALIPFAALTLASVASWLRTKNWRPAALCLAALAMLSLWTARPLPAGMSLIRRADYTSAWTAYYRPEVEASGSRGDSRRVARLLAEYLQYEPPVVSELGLKPHHRAPENHEAGLAAFSGRIRQMYAQALYALGETAKADEQANRAMELLQAGNVQR